MEGGLALADGRLGCDRLFFLAPGWSRDRRRRIESAEVDRWTGWQHSSKTFLRLRVHVRFPGPGSPPSPTRCVAGVGGNEGVRLMIWDLAPSPRSMPQTCYALAAVTLAPPYMLLLRRESVPGLLLRREPTPGRVPRAGRAYIDAVSPRTGIGVMLPPPTDVWPIDAVHREAERCYREPLPLCRL